MPCHFVALLCSVACLELAQREILVQISWFSSIPFTLTRKHYSLVLVVVLLLLVGSLFTSNRLLMVLIFTLSCPLIYLYAFWQFLLLALVTSRHKFVLENYSRCFLCMFLNASSSYSLDSHCVGLSLNLKSILNFKYTFIISFFIYIAFKMLKKSIIEYMLKIITWH